MQTFPESAREAKTNNAKANILANFGGGDLSPRPAGILMRRPVMVTYPYPVVVNAPSSEGLIEDTRLAQSRGGLESAGATVAKLRRRAFTFPPSTVTGNTSW